MNRFHSLCSITAVVCFSSVGVLESAQGNYWPAWTALVLAAALTYITWLEQELQRTLKLADECLDGWRKSSERWSVLLAEAQAAIKNESQNALRKAGK